MLHPPAPHQHLAFSQRIDDFARQQDVTEFAVEVWRASKRFDKSDLRKTIPDINPHMPGPITPTRCAGATAALALSERAPIRSTRQAPSTRPSIRQTSAARSAKWAGPAQSGPGAPTPMRSSAANPPYGRVMQAVAIRTPTKKTIIPLDLGGAPADQHNLWPEPRISSDGWTAGRKDSLERLLKRLVCERRSPLVLAQRAITLDWRAA